MDETYCIVVPAQILCRVVWRWHEFDTSVWTELNSLWPIPPFFTVGGSFNRTSDHCMNHSLKIWQSLMIRHSWCSILALQVRYKCLSCPNICEFGWNPKWCLIFIQVIWFFYPARAKGLFFFFFFFKSLIKFFPLSCLTLGVKVVVWVDC